MDEQKPIEGAAPYSLRVLIVEDSPRDAELVIREIRRGYPDLRWKRVETVEEMQTALLIEAWDLVVSDFSLPHSDGFGALAVLQQTGLDLPFIIVSGTIGEETAVAAMRAGAHDYLMKDKLAHLVPAIRRELDNAQVRTSARAAHLTLRTSELRYRRLFESAQDGILILDAVTGMIVDINPFLVELLGISHDDVLDKKLWEIGLFAGIAANEATFVQLQQQDAHYEDLPLNTRDGRCIDVEFVSNVYEVEHRKVIQCNIRDITARKQMENALRESETRFATVFHASPIAIALAKIEDSTLINVNPAWETMTGYSPEEALGHTTVELGIWVDPDERDRMIKMLQTQGTIQGFNLTLRRKSGEATHAAMSAVTFRVGNDACLLTMAVDITDRIQVERALEESKALIETVVENVPLMIFLKEAEDLRFVLFNRAGEELLGYDRTELLGKNNLDLFPPDQAAFFMAKDREVLASETGWLDIPEEPIQIAAKGQRLLHTTKIRVLGTDGATKYLLGISEDVTEHKRAEEELRASETRYRSIFDNSVLGISQALPDGRLLCVNQAYAAMYGYANPADILSEAPNVSRRFADPNDRDEVMRLLNAHGVMAPREFNLVHRDGSPFVALVAAREIRDSAGALLFNQAEHIDISDRKRTEEALRESEERYRTLIESSNDGIVITDGDADVFLYVNPALCRMLGYTCEEMATLGPKDIHPQTILPEIQDAFVSQTQGQHAFGDGVPCLRKDGAIIYAEITGTSITIKGKTYPVAVFHDVTERKRAEAALRESEARYRLLFEDAQDGIALADIQTGTLIECNAALCRMVERNKPDLLGQPEMILHPEPQTTAGRSPSFVEQGNRDAGQILEDTLLSRTGKVIPVEIRAAHITLLGRDCLLGIFRDMSERQQMEGQLRQQQRLETVGQLAAGVAHDFNNLLTGITGYTQFVHDTAPEGSSAREDLAVVLKLASRAAELTHQLLAFSRHQPLRPVVLNVNDLITESAKMLQRLLGEHLQLHWQLATPLQLVKVDPGQFEQVLVNLVVNARDAMPDGGQLTVATANVVLDATYAASHVGVTPGAYVLLRVTDTGSGMEASVLEHIFEPFFTTKGVDKGTGLGLATIYGIIKQHGGSIFVCSQPGHGTTFEVYWPVSTGDDCTPASTLPTAVPIGAATILLVEDDDAVRQVTTRHLQSLGYTVCTAALPSIAEVVLCAQGDDIDLLLTDVKMPECSGPQLYAAVRTRFPRLRVLYMSGYISDALGPDGLLDPGTPLLEKPFTSATLAQKVHEALHGGYDVNAP